MLGKNHLIMNTSNVVLLSHLYSYLVLKFGVYFGTTFLLFENHVIYLKDGNFSFPYSVLCFVLFVFGTYLPDIDEPSSKLGRYIHIPIKHRTYTHTIWVLIFISFLSIFYGAFFWLLLGYFLHLFWDDLSRSGIAWFYPITKYRSYPNGAKIVDGKRFYLYRVGQASEYVLVTVFVIFALLSIYSRLDFIKIYEFFKTTDIGNLLVKYGILT